jgi:hypothetical protein
LIWIESCGSCALGICAAEMCSLARDLVIGAREPICVAHDHAHELT